MTAAILLFMGFQEILVVMVIVLLLFGSKRIPEVARGLGKGIRMFKDATNDIQRDIQDSVNDVSDEVDIRKHLKD